MSVFHSTPRRYHIQVENVVLPWLRRAWIGKLTSTTSDKEVEDEVRSVFCEQMGGRKDFPFAFLQPAGVGTRILSIPLVSSSFRWTASQVAKLGGHKQAIYIMAMESLKSEVITCNFVPRLSLLLIWCGLGKVCDHVWL